MITPSEKLARKIGRIDAFIFFVAWAIVGMLSSTTLFGALPLIVLVLVPSSALVGWRGAVFTRRVLASTKPSVNRSVFEGFGWGAVVALLVWLWGLSNYAMAAGTVLDGLSPTSIHFWVSVATSLIPVLLIAGLCGAATGFVFHFINLWLVERLR